MIVETGLVLAGVGLAKLHDHIVGRVLYTEDERARINAGKRQARKMREERIRRAKATKKAKTTKKKNTKKAAANRRRKKKAA